MSTALIIGASRGIGLGLAQHYAADGWTVHATQRTPSALLKRSGAVIHRLDVRDRTGGEDLVAEIDSGEVDLLIHNAGVYHGVSRAEMMEVNAVAPIGLVQAALDAGIVASGGRIGIMTSQTGARRGRTGSLGAYGDSKAALNDEFRSRAADWARHGVVAVVIHPGWVRTDMGGDGAPLSVTESVAGISRVLAELTTADHGSFLTWDGQTHSW